MERIPTSPFILYLAGYPSLKLHYSIINERSFSSDLPKELCQVTWKLCIFIRKHYYLKGLRPFCITYGNQTIAPWACDLNLTGWNIHMPHSACQQFYYLVQMETCWIYSLKCFLCFSWFWLSGNVFKCLGEIFKRMKHITSVEMSTFQTKYWQISEYLG